MKLLLMVSLALILGAHYIATEFPCGDWEPYLNGKCIKLLPQVDNYSVAESLCAAEDNPEMLSIPSPEGYAFIENYTRTLLPLNHDIWLEGWSKIEEFPGNYGSSEYEVHYLKFKNVCLYMSSPKHLSRVWSAGDCKDVKHIICEKKEPPIMSQVKKLLSGNLTENLTEMKEKMREVTGKIASMDGQIASRDGKIASMDGKIASMDGKIASLESQIASLNSKLNSTSSPSTPQSGGIEDPSWIICFVILLCLGMLIIMATRQGRMIRQNSQFQSQLLGLKDGPVEDGEKAFPFK